jgi:hypothetical protein
MAAAPVAIHRYRDLEFVVILAVQVGQVVAVVTLTV